MSDTSDDERADLGCASGGLEKFERTLVRLGERLEEVRQAVSSMGSAMVATVEMSKTKTRAMEIEYLECVLSSVLDDPSDREEVGVVLSSIAEYHAAL